MKNRTLGSLQAARWLAQCGGGAQANSQAGMTDAEKDRLFAYDDQYLDERRMSRTASHYKISRVGEMHCIAWIAYVHLRGAIRVATSTRYLYRRLSANYGGIGCSHRSEYLLFKV
jgi:hypothetical protein